MLRQRVITAVALLAILLAAAGIGRLAFDAVLALLLGVATFEWLRLAQHSTRICVAAAAGFAVSLIAVQAASRGPSEAILGLLLVAASVCWCLIGVLVVRGAHRGARVPHALSTVLAFLLLAAAWYAAMRFIDVGLPYLLSVLAIVWLADIAAYFSGRRWGRRKLAPAISPGKTWAGVAGAVAAVLAGAMLAFGLSPDTPVFSTLLQQRLAAGAALAVLAVLVGLSIVGDLFESLLKRQVDVKDAGHVLPGHGGVLDRIDASIAVLPVAALIDLWLRR